MPSPPPTGWSGQVRANACERAVAISAALMNAVATATVRGYARSARKLDPAGQYFDAKEFAILEIR
jgi:hypothetical protein